MNQTNLYVNAIGTICLIAVGAYSVRAMFEDKSAPPCSRTYEGGVQFPYENQSGAPFSPIELQARAGGSERNVLENAKVVQQSGAPARSVMEVRINGKEPEGGIESAWNASTLRTAKSACLAYSVWLPGDFAFADLGTLPGLYGGSKLGPEDQPKDGTGFAARVRWRDQGASELFAQLSGGPDGVGIAIPTNNAALASGRWVRVEQEVVLNDPGQSNGQLRLWLDGHLVAESSEVELRRDPSIVLAGVAGDIGYGGKRPEGTAKDVFIRVSPFEISWK